MAVHYLEFERPIADLEAKIDELSRLAETAGTDDLSHEIDALRDRDIELDDDTFVDVVCVALNELPAKYIRHDVDMAYFTDPSDMAIINSRIERAIDLALGRVLSKRGPRDLTD
jgi:hypothetical protein